MTIAIKVPALGESVAEATVAKWFKAVGENVAADEAVCEIETDKVSVEVYAQASGTLADIVAPAGATVGIGGLLGHIAEGKAAAKPTSAESRWSAEVPAAPVAAPPQLAASRPAPAPLSPAVRKLVAEHGIPPEQVAGSGRDGRLTKGDVLKVVGAAQP
ncbi:MAG: dihydrolipoamide succinyltransferase, partial [Alphaproteobacteria bacterium]|nr:dihydrolipoamide succinyltransferase [Alphaproteobacteria bacterium]